MSLTQISILGCGWLGFPLAISLKRKGYQIQGSTTSEEKTAVLKNAGIAPFLIWLNTEKISGEAAAFLNGSQLLIINVPPGMRGNSPELFSSKIEKLLPFIEKSTVKNVLFVSSTSVFGDAQGVVDEYTLPEPDTFSGKDLWKTEKLLQANPHFKTTIIRFGGLIGEDRHPVYYLAGKSNLKNGKSPVNLIHRNDCIELIEKIIEFNYWGKTVHGVFPYHPAKEKYYINQAVVKNLPLPHFENSDNLSQKKVISCVIGKGLLFAFHNPIE